MRTAIRRTSPTTTRICLGPMGRTASATVLPWRSCRRGGGRRREGGADLVVPRDRLRRHGYWSDVIAAIDEITAAAPRPAVVNVSYAGSVSTAANAAIRIDRERVMYVVAAGNHDDDAANYSPSNTPRSRCRRRHDDERPPATRVEFWAAARPVRSRRGDRVGVAA